VDRIIACEHLNEQRKQPNDLVAVHDQHPPIQTSGGYNPAELIEQVNPPYYKDILTMNTQCPNRITDQQYDEANELYGVQSFAHVQH